MFSQKLIEKFKSSFVYRIISFFSPEKILKAGFVAIISIVFIIFSIDKYINNESSGYIFEDVEEIQQKQVALVLGALVYTDGSLSDMLTDRMDTAIELYNKQKIQKILISGDHGTKEYDEVNAMKNYLLENGVKASDIFLDHAGFDTYDSIYRAKEIFQVDSIIIVTQEFHLPRAVFIANSLGVDSEGLVADKHIYQDADRNVFREKFAKVKAFFDISLHTSPKFKGEQIPITGDSKLSWD